MWVTSVNVLKHTHHMALLEDGNWVLFYSFGIIGYYFIIKVETASRVAVNFIFSSTNENTNAYSVYIA